MEHVFLNTSSATAMWTAKTRVMRAGVVSTLNCKCDECGVVNTLNYKCDEGWCGE